MIEALSAFTAAAATFLAWDTWRVWRSPPANLAHPGWRAVFLGFRVVAVVGLAVMASRPFLGAHP